MESIDFKNFIEHDSNPFILFDFRGHIIYLNNSAEVLFGYIQPKELYNMALEYAPKNYGHKSILTNINIDTSSFFAIMVGYENDESIYIRLYNKPLMQQSVAISKETLALTDINSLFEANITLFEIQSPKSKLSLFVDKDLPMFKIDQNNFSKIIRKMLATFIGCKQLNIELKLIFGEYIIIEESKHQILELTLSSSSRDKSFDDDINKIINSGYLNCIIKDNSFRLKIPIIL